MKLLKDHFKTLAAKELERKNKNKNATQQLIHIN